MKQEHHRLRSISGFRKVNGKPCFFSYVEKDKTKEQKEEKSQEVSVNGFLKIKLPFEGQRVEIPEDKPWYKCW